MLLLDRATATPRPTSAVAVDRGRRRTWLFLGAALILCLGLRLPYMNFPLGTDEGGVAFIAKAWGTGGHGSLYGAYWLDRPPLLVVLYKLAVPGGEVGIRALGMLAGLVLVASTTLLARAVAGHAAARVAALLSAGLAGSIAIGAVFSNAELLAAAPACASVACLVAAHRRGQARWLVGASLLAVSAALIKQSFLDAGFAGAIFLIATSVRDRRPRLRWAGAYAAGALIALVPVAIWLYAARLAPGSLVYAVFGFRIDALHALEASNLPLHVRMRSLILPGERSGLFIVLVLALGGLWTLRRDRVLAATLVAWLAAGVLGVLGGGSYWPHYLIQLIAPASLLAGAALGGLRLPIRAAAVVALVAVAVIGTVDAGPVVRSARARGGVVAVAGYVRAHARPGDTQYVMYAKANAGYYTGLQSPYPYAWSLLVRAHPDAMPRLLHLLRSPRRPTWLIEWQRPDRWNLDPSHAIERALHSHYRVVAHRHGHAIYHRTSSPARPLPRGSPS